MDDSNRFAAALNRQISADAAKMQKDLQISIQKGLQNLGRNSVKRFRALVKNYFYDSIPESQYYHRLEENGGFLNTISYEVINNKVRIYCDWGKLTYISSQENGGFGSHVGFDGEKFTDGLYDYVIKGWYSPPNSGGKKEKRHVNFERRLEKDINDWMEEQSDELVFQEVKKVLGDDIKYSDFVSGKLSTAQRMHKKHS